MSLPTRYLELYHDGLVAKRAGFAREGALLMEQAYRLAQQCHMPEAAFEAGVWAVDCYETFDPLHTLELLTELLADVPPQVDPAPVCHARLKAFHMYLFWMPSCQDITTRLEELERMVVTHPTIVLPSDVPYLRGRFSYSCGQWSSALEQFELAWSRYTPGRGFPKHAIAQYAIHSNLQLRDRRAAGRWCAQLAEMHTDPSFDRVAWYEAQAETSLWDGRTDDAKIAAEAMEERAASLQRPDWQQRVCDLRVRTQLLHAPSDDPADARHAARQLLTARVGGKLYVHVQYERLRLLADYRLACVRHAAGVPPVDDLWYQHPQTLPDRPPAAPADFQRRVFHARRAYGRALRYSKHLDGCFECDWRQEEIREHRSRLEAIVAKVGAMSGL